MLFISIFIFIFIFKFIFINQMYKYYRGRRVRPRLLHPQPVRVFDAFLGGPGQAHQGGIERKNHVDGLLKHEAVAVTFGGDHDAIVGQEGVFDLARRHPMASHTWQDKRRAARRFLHLCLSGLASLVWRRSRPSGSCRWPRRRIFYPARYNALSFLLGKGRKTAGP